MGNPSYQFLYIFRTNLRLLHNINFPCQADSRPSPGDPAPRPVLGHRTPWAATLQTESGQPLNLLINFRRWFPAIPRAALPPGWPRFITFICTYSSLLFKLDLALKFETCCMSWFKGYDTHFSVQKQQSAVCFSLLLRSKRAHAQLTCQFSGSVLIKLYIICLPEK